jgi:dienelactone hydrolase
MLKVTRIASLFFLTACVSFCLSEQVLARAMSGEQISIPRPDGSALNFYFAEPAGKGPYSILLYLQGSSCDSSGNDAATASVLNKYEKMGRVVSEKYGVSEHDQGCPSEYLNHNSIPQRVADYRQIFDYLRKFDSRWNRQLYIIGVSEGAIIGPEVAHEIPETAGLSLMAGSGTDSLAEQLVFLKVKKMKAGQSRNSDIKKEVALLKNQFNEMRANPTPNLSWDTSTDTYYYWSGILDYHSSDFLKQFDFPLYIDHGTEDADLAIEPTRKLIQQFEAEGRTNVTYREHQGLNHFWDDEAGGNHYEETMNMVIDGMLSNAEAFHSQDRLPVCPRRFHRTAR